MKIKTKVFVAFLKKVMMTKSQLINECIFNFSDEGLRISASNEASMSKVNALLYKSAFSEYNPIGKIGIGEMPNIVKILDRFSEDIKLNVEGNLLTVSQTGKKVEIELMDPKFINVNEKALNLSFDDSFVLESDKLHEILDDVKLNDDCKIKIITEPGKLKMVNSGKYKFHHSFDSPSCKGGVIVEFGQPLLHAVGELSENLIINVKTDYPMQITENVENVSEIVFIIAPLVGVED